MVPRSRTEPQPTRGRAIAAPAGALCQLYFSRAHVCGFCAVLVEWSVAIRIRNAGGHRHTAGAPNPKNSSYLLLFWSEEAFSTLFIFIFILFPPCFFIAFFERSSRRGVKKDEQKSIGAHKTVNVFFFASLVLLC
jgi:hypothetical protein